MESNQSVLAVVPSPAELPEADSEGDKPPAASLALVPAFDLERVPMHLREIFIYAQKWGIGDDRELHDLLEQTSEGELRQMAEAVAPYLQDIREWEAGGEPCSELETYRALARAHHTIERSFNFDF